MKMFVMINKALLLVLFAVFVLNLLMPFGGDAGQWIMRIGLVVLGVHVLELLVIYKKIAGRRSCHRKQYLLDTGSRHLALETFT